MEEYKKKILDLIDSLDKDNIELALEISKGLGLQNWAIYEITDIYNYLHRFIYNVQSDTYFYNRYSVIFEQYVSYTPSCLNDHKKLISALRKKAGLVSRYIAWG